MRTLQTRRRASAASPSSTSTTPSTLEIVSVVTNANLLNGAYRIKALGKFVYVAATYAAAVAAVDVSDPLAPRVAGGYKSTPLLNRAPGLDVDPAGVYLVAVSPFLSTESQPTFPPYPFDPGGPVLTGTVAVVALDPAPASVTIAAASKPANPTSQTTANFTFTTANAVATVQCQLDNLPPTACTSATTQAYASLGLGQHTFTVRATDASGFVSTDSYTWTIVVPVPPTASVLDSFNRPDGPVGANWSVCLRRLHELRGQLEPGSRSVCDDLRVELLAGSAVRARLECVRHAHLGIRRCGPRLRTVHEPVDGCALRLLRAGDRGQLGDSANRLREHDRARVGVHAGRSGRIPGRDRRRRIEDRGVVRAAGRRMDVPLPPDRLDVSGSRLPRHSSRGACSSTTSAAAPSGALRRRTRCCRR